MASRGAPAANAALVAATFEQSAATRALVARDDPALEAVVEELGHRVVDETWLRETTGVDLDLVAALEADLTPVDDGLRLGAPAAAAAVRERVVAFETVEGGTKPRGRAAVADPGVVGHLIDALAGVLEAKYRTVTRESDRVVATRRTFDPAAAADAGVPEGPAFGRLAAGESVEVDGRTISPEEVHAEETATFQT